MTKPSKILQNIPTLKMKLVTATQFQEVFHYFLDLVEDPALHSASEITRHEALEETLVLNIGQIFKTSDVVKERVFLERIAKYQFLYGSAVLNRQQLMTFYFEDIDSGMIALAPRTPLDQPMFVRFACIDPETWVSSGMN